MVVSTPKELDFFSQHYDRGFSWYEQHFVDVQSQICGEISPSYFHHTAAAERAASYEPGLKILLTLRDPVERAFSNHLHQVRLGLVSGPDLSFESGLENNPMYLEQSRYSTHLQRWLQWFPMGQILVLLQEDIRVDPVREAKRVYRFLELDEAHRSDFLNKRANESYSETLKGIDATFKFAGRLGRRLGIADLVERLKRNRLIYGIRQANRRHLTQVVPRMRSDTRSELEQLFAPEVEELARLVGRDRFPWATWEHFVERSPKAPDVSIGA